MSRHHLAAEVASKDAECFVGPDRVATNVVGGKQGQPAVTVLLVNLDELGHFGKRQYDAARAGFGVGQLEEAVQQIGGAVVDGELAQQRRSMLCDRTHGRKALTRVDAPIRLWTSTEGRNPTAWRRRAKTIGSTAMALCARMDLRPEPLCVSTEIAVFRPKVSQFR